MEEVTFNNMAAQGDLLIRRIEDIPEGCSKMKPENGEYIVAHSETGHHHVISGNSAVALLESPNPGVRYLETTKEVRLRHKRPWHTHKTIVIPPGKFELRRQREMRPSGWEYVVD